MNTTARKRGRPRKDIAPEDRPEPQRSRNITISDRLWDRARILGQGSPSQGIRLALELEAHSSLVYESALIVDTPPAPDTAKASDSAAD